MKEDPTRPPAAQAQVPAGLDGLTTAEYQELCGLAHHLRRRLASSRGVPGTESLVHEMYLRLKGAGHESWHDRAHFIAVAVLQLRHLLVDHARATAAQKRGGEHVLVSFDEGAFGVARSALDVVVVDEALQRLARHDARQHQVAELRLFGGLSVAEIAAVLAVSERTVKEDWRQAREFLARALRSKPQADS